MGVDQQQVGQGAFFNAAGVESERTGAAQRGGLHQSAEWQRLWLLAPSLLNHRNGLEALADIQVVGRSGAVGTDTNVAARIFQLVEFELITRTEQQVRIDVVGYIHVTAAQNLNIFIVQPDAVGRYGAGAQQAELVEVLRRGEAELFDILAGLKFGLGEVEVEQQVVLLRKLAGPGHGLFRGGVIRVDGDAEPDAVRPFARCGEDLQALATLRCRLILIEVIQKDIGDHAADTDLFCRTGHGLREPIHVQEGGGAGLEHLQKGELGTPVDSLFVQIFLNLPDIVQPFLQRGILADAAREGHGGMGMHVDESGDHGVVTAVYFAVGTHPFAEIRSDARNPVALDEDVGLGAVQGYLFEKDGTHRRGL